MLPVTDRSAKRAARAILELINSRPVSPRAEEIEAILKRTVAEDRSAEQGRAAAYDPLDEYGPDLTKHKP